MLWIVFFSFEDGCSKLVDGSQAHAGDGMESVGRGTWLLVCDMTKHARFSANSTNSMCCMCAATEGGGQATTKAGLMAHSRHNARAQTNVSPLNCQICCVHSSVWCCPSMTGTRIHPHIAPCSLDRDAAQCKAPSCREQTRAAALAHSLCSCVRCVCEALVLFEDQTLQLCHHVDLAAQEVGP